jgi:hypothetical protein
MTFDEGKAALQEMQAAEESEADEQALLERVDGVRSGVMRVGGQVGL